MPIKNRVVTDEVEYEIIDQYDNPRVSKREIETLTTSAIEMINSVVGNYKNIFCGWTGGKDSLVIASLLDKSNCKYTPINFITSYEFVSFMQFIDKIKPNNLITLYADAYHLPHLNVDGGLLFLKRPKSLGEWIKKKLIVQRRELKRLGCDLFVTGRRTEDKNFCGKKENNYVAPANTFPTFSPIAEWTNEQILAYMKYNGLLLAPLYYYKNGFSNGTGGWPKITAINGNDYDTWDYLMTIDPDIVINASKYIDTAREYMEKNYAS
jgi:3'-phosphoadenosine 5'-phosphosulfate sulfotransferase (PAPS reductase)/FAD synthetase